MTPRTRLAHNQVKKIKLSFRKDNQAPVTTCDAYKIGKVMGKGAFGKVNLAIHRLSNKFVALKSINKSAM
jgi:serine/threonine protein kinase